MVDQAQVNGAAKRSNAGVTFRENVGGLLHDVIELGELQTQLLVIDLNEARRGSVLSIAVGVAAVVLALGSVPVFLLGIGWLLVTFAGWNESAAFAATGGGALVVAALLGWFAFHKLYAAIKTMSRSGDEFATNVAWIKNALKQSNSPSRRSSNSGATSHDESQERTSLQ